MFTLNFGLPSLREELVGKGFRKINVGTNKTAKDLFPFGNPFSARLSRGRKMPGIRIRAKNMRSEKSLFAFD